MARSAKEVTAVDDSAPCELVRGGHSFARYVESGPRIRLGSAPVSLDLTDA
jgi:hypothetical protein